MSTGTHACCFDLSVQVDLVPGKRLNTGEKTVGEILPTHKSHVPQGYAEFNNLGFCSETPLGGVFNTFEVLQSAGKI